MRGKVLLETTKQADYRTIAKYGELTNDHNPIHTDRAFAMTTEMGGIIAHGTLGLSLIWISLRKTLGDEAAAGAVLDVRFTAPVREDDVVTAGGQEVEDMPGLFDVWAKTGSGRIVIKGTATVPGAGTRP